MSNDISARTYFSLPEAQLTLQRILPIIEEMASLSTYLFQQGYNLYDLPYFGGTGEMQHSGNTREAQRVAELVEMLKQEGLVVTNIEEGFVDFPTLRENGEEAFFCYRLGDEEIRFWHAADKSCAHRTNLDTM
jgi:hypothetical protein